MAKEVRQRRRGATPKDALKAIRSGSLKRVVSLMIKDHKAVLLPVVICIIISSAATSFGSLYMQSMIDRHIVPLIGTAHPDMAPLFASLAVMIAIYAVGTAAGYIYNTLMVNISQGTIKKIRISLFEKMETLPISYFDTHAHGDIMSVYTNDTDTLRQFIGMAFPQMLSSLASLISSIISMLILNIPLTFLTIIMMFGIVMVSGKVASISGKHFLKQQQDLGKLNGFIEEQIEGEKVIKVFSHEEKSIEEFRELNEALRKSALKANSAANIIMPVTAQLGNLDYAICAVIGAVFAVNGYFGVTVGTVVSFLTLNKGFNRLFMQLSTQMNAVVQASAGANRIYELMDSESEADEGYVTLVNASKLPDGTLAEASSRTGLWAWKHFHKAENTTTYKRLEGDIVMEGVNFGYIPEKIVLHDITLYAHKGQKIAFVGSTGAGKTTITNLINRFYDIQSGKIRYDGINIEKIKKDDLRRSLGVVLQETNLFTGTVMENIRYGRLDATDAECMNAAKLANADGFIKRLPNGYDTVLSGNGADLSQGQRQLLAIARAAVADPPVLILDEATSSIDTRTESIVQKGMDSLMKGRTTFVIAHRLSTVRNADCIMVLESGRITERGSHEELMAQKGRYYTLYTGGKDLGNAVSNATAAL